ncbi:MAG: P-loop NTPase [Candidatus Heimdallarchaeaceae archaeon]
MIDKKIIGIVSSKGGVGKTTITANLGCILSHDFRKNVLIVDGNVKTSNLAMQFGETKYPITLHDVLNSKYSISKAIYKTKGGLHILPSSLEYSSEIDSLFLNKRIRRAFKIYDIVLLDSPPGIGKDTLSVIQCCDGVIVVTEPTFPSVATTLKMIELLKRLNVPIIGVVVNITKKKKYEMRIDDIEKALGAKIIGVVPQSDKVLEALAHKIPIALYAPKSNCSEALRSIAFQLTEEKIVEKESFFSRFRKIFVLSKNKKQKKRTKQKRKEEDTNQHLKKMEKELKEQRKLIKKLLEKTKENEKKEETIKQEEPVIEQKEETVEEKEQSVMPEIEESSESEVEK